MCIRPTAKRHETKQNQGQHEDVMTTSTQAELCNLLVLKSTGISWFGHWPTPFTIIGSSFIFCLFREFRGKSAPNIGPKKPFHTWFQPKSPLILDYVLIKNWHKFGAMTVLPRTGFWDKMGCDTAFAKVSRSLPPARVSGDRQECVASDKRWEGQRQNRTDSTSWKVSSKKTAARPSQRVVGLLLLMR